MRSRGKKIKRYFETSENKNTITQNIWDIAKAALMGNFIVLQVHPSSYVAH